MCYICAIVSAWTMYSINVELKNYHSVREASVNIQGLTVLTGPNGSGKSTVARNLFYYLYVTNNMERLLTDRWILRLESLYMRIREIGWMLTAELGESGRELRNLLQTSKLKSDADIALEAFQHFLDLFEDLMATVNSAAARKRILSSPAFRTSYEKMLNSGQLKEGSLWRIKVSALLADLRNNILQGRKNIDLAKESMDIRQVSGIVNDVFNNVEGLPEEFVIKEDGSPYFPSGK